MNNKSITQSIVVFYHANCSDGFSSAWVAWKKFGDSSVYVPVQHGTPFPLMPEDKEVYMVDIIPAEEVLKEIILKNKVVIAIDHHATNQEKIALIPGAKFDLTKSGAVLTWEYFFPNTPVPKLLQYVQDMDLWQWKLPQSKEIISYLDLFDFDFETWNQLAVDMEDSTIREGFVKQGSLIENYENKEVEKIIKNNAQLVLFEGFKVLAVNSSNLHSKIGNELVIKNPPIGIIWQQRSDKISISLRSDGTVSVGELAKKYGGGGHPKSAGFEISLDGQLPWKILKNEDEK